MLGAWTSPFALSAQRDGPILMNKYFAPVGAFADVDCPRSQH